MSCIPISLSSSLPPSLLPSPHLPRPKSPPLHCTLVRDARLAFSSMTLSVSTISRCRCSSPFASSMDVAIIPSMSCIFLSLLASLCVYTTQREKYVTSLLFSCPTRSIMTCFCFCFFFSLLGISIGRMKSEHQFNCVHA
ncbi:hypothetical protein BDW59DRAFT_59757 [Aspergillus cavernicola]|uniref:Uncharacterized protein n=1 Tax=Aspergillus cavernicola TaxID=176166 RepID=A0ABR4IJR9_9EURO